MKKIFTVLSATLVLFVASFSFINKSSTGMAGYTGSPGEATCTSCHSGGSSSASGLTISAVPAFVNNQYMADSTYQINIQVGAVGYNRFGFDAEILDSLQNDAGVMQGAGPGVKFQTVWNGRKNALHSTKKSGTNGATFTFQWVAPSSGKVEMYACGNAVNNDNNTSGDLPIPGSLVLYPAPAVPQDTSVLTTLRKEVAQISQVSVYPNPTLEKISVSYYLKTSKAVSIELTSLNGTECFNLSKTQREAGLHNEILQVPQLASGVYFIKISLDGKQAASKIVVLR